MSKDKLLKSINKLDVMGNKEEFKSILTTMVNGTEEKEIKDPSKPAPNEIWYTTADGQICNVPNRNYFINCLGYSEDEVKFEVVSNVYKNGKGVITFKDPVIACGYANDLEYYGLEGDVEEGLYFEFNEDYYSEDISFRNVTSVTFPDQMLFLAYGTIPEMCSVSIEHVNFPQSLVYGECYIYHSVLDNIVIPENTKYFYMSSGGIKGDIINNSNFTLDELGDVSTNNGFVEENGLVISGFLIYCIRPYVKDLTLDASDVLSFGDYVNPAYLDSITINSKYSSHSYERFFDYGFPCAKKIIYDDIVLFRDNAICMFGDVKYNFIIDAKSMWYSYPYKIIIKDGTYVATATIYIAREFYIPKSIGMIGNGWQRPLVFLDELNKEECDPSAEYINIINYGGTKSLFNLLLANVITAADYKAYSSPITYLVDVSNSYDLKIIYGDGTYDIIPNSELK